MYYIISVRGKQSFAGVYHTGLCFVRCNFCSIPGLATDDKLEGIDEFDCLASGPLWSMISFFCKHGFLLLLLALSVFPCMGAGLQNMLWGLRACFS